MHSQPSVHVALTSGHTVQHLHTVPVLHGHGLDWCAHGVLGRTLGTARLEAMWRAWEHLRMDAATGTSVWLRDHADHHLGVLMSPTGPWALSKDTAGPDEPLPYEAPPEGLFPDIRDH